MFSMTKKSMKNMVDEIDREVLYTSELIGRKKLGARVMAAMAKVPRDAFVPEDLKADAYLNRPLPIGHGQTISQPYIVALMTDLLALKPKHKVLEIGTGCGYQAAILSQLCETVYSMDVIPQLVESARVTLDKLGYDNIELRSGNGYEGWPEHAPYDGIIVTAAAEQVPTALVDQLKPGGRLVIPVGPPYGYQELKLVSKDNNNAPHTRNILGVAFVPMVNRPAGNDSDSVE
jgi:protein-L-isoaspartate(D-aspartate) O-methyltransferase